MYFYFSPDHGFCVVDTEQEAREGAEKALDYYRHEAGDGWSEDVTCVCWGPIRETAQEVSREPAPEGSSFDYIAEYDLRPVGITLPTE